MNSKINNKIIGENTVDYHSTSNPNNNNNNKIGRSNTN